MQRLFLAFKSLLAEGFVVKAVLFDLLREPDILVLSEVEHALLADGTPHSLELLSWHLVAV